MKRLLPKSISNPRGFTLIELLIVVSTIAILTAVRLISYTNFIKNSRDNKRQSDLKFIQSSLEEYHSDQIYYPSTITIGSTITNLTGRPTPSPVPTTKTYLNLVPSDPLSSNAQYSFQPSPSACDNGTNNCISYCLYAKVEGITIPASDSACSPAPSPYNFGITRP